jgi:alkanesulfonate monooxygenase SsuD/methylene tetrahydromethanopterin reductase-like flavin-dependent oxidoreductase (luciferase family)
MQAGLVIPVQTDAADFAARAEAAGFDYLASGEHVAMPGAAANSFMTLAVAAGATRRIRLLSTVCVLPLYPAALAAKLSSELDRLSNGRFELGVGVGGEYPDEFRACGVPVSERGPRTDEGLELIDALLRGGEVRSKGRWHDADGVRLNPPPLQQPRPPIWVAGRREVSWKRAARYDGWLPFVDSPEQLAAKVRSLRAYAAAQRGGAPWPGRVAPVLTITAYADGARARSVAVETLSAFYGRDVSHLLGRHLIAGTAAVCLEQLQAFRAAGSDAFILGLSCPPEDIQPMFDLLATELLPALHAL